MGYFGLIINGKIRNTVNEPATERGVNFKMEKLLRISSEQ